jgi:creatinine amidohydrolase
MRLGEQPWTHVDGSAHLLIPLGSTEQHGPHLPLDTDTRIALAVAHGVAESTSATVGPALPYGASGEHAGFAGTLSIGTEALHMVLVELVRSASTTFDKITLVNGHGGNLDAVRRAKDQLTDEGHNVAMWFPVIPGGDAHAGRTETSIMLAIAPETVRLEAAEPGNTAPLSEIIDDLRRGGVAAASSNGVLGDPTGATATEGQALLKTLIADLAASC